MMSLWNVKFIFCINFNVIVFDHSLKAEIEKINNNIVEDVMFWKLSILSGKIYVVLNV